MFGNFEPFGLSFICLNNFYQLLNDFLNIVMGFLLAILAFLYIFKAEAALKWIYSLYYFLILNLFNLPLFPPLDLFTSENLRLNLAQ